CYTTTYSSDVYTVMRYRSRAIAARIFGGYLVLPFLNWAILRCSVKSPVRIVVLASLTCRCRLLVRLYTVHNHRNLTIRSITGVSTAIRCTRNNKGFVDRDLLTLCWRQNFYIM